MNSNNIGAELGLKQTVQASYFAIFLIQYSIKPSLL